MTQLFALIGLSLVAFPSYLFAASVYVVSDGYKILPDGAILEFNRRPPGQLKVSNTLWNAAAKEIRVAGARNEVVAFQVVCEGEASGLNVESTGLTGPGTLPKDAVSFHLVGYVSWQGAYYPDVVIPLNWKGVAPFSIPYNHLGLISIPQQRVGVVMVEVKIPRDAVPGVYNGQIRISGDVNETLHLSLTVWDFTLPIRPSIVFDFNSYGSPVGVVSEDNRNPYLPTSDETIQAEHEFYRCANRHRAYLNILPTHSQRGKPFYAPALMGQGKTVRCDWTYWDKRFGPALDGSIFDDGEPLPYFYLPFNLHWPWGYSHDKQLDDRRLNWRKAPEYAKDHTLLIHPEYLDEWKAVAGQMIAHFAERGWTRTTYQVYLNHSDQANANSPWRLDEPYDRWGFQTLAYYADLTHRVFANTKGVKVKFRLDLGHFYCRTPTMRCHHPKKYDLPLSREGGGAELLEPVVDIWYIGTPHTFGNRAKVYEVGARDEDKEMFVYGGGQQVEDGATVHRSLHWYLYDFKEKGYCAWNEGCRAPETPLEKSGADHVWYSAKGLGLMGPAPSLRMKLWRRGSFDAEYLILAEQKSSREAVIQILNWICEYKKYHPKYTHIDFPYPNNNPEDYEIARLKLASIILGREVGGDLTFRGRIDGPPQQPVEQITGY